MKLIVTPTNSENLKDLIAIGVKDFIVYPDKLRVKNASTFTTDKLKQLSSICKENDCNLFLSINKILHNKDLVLLEELLKSLKEIELTGIIYSDYAVYMTCKELNLDVNLYYDGDMLATNSFTTTYLNDSMVFLSKELYYEEIEEMAKRIKGELVIQAQGLIGMFHSIRPLVSNYRDYLNKDFDVSSKENTLYDEERDLNYPIIENEDGAFIMGGKEVSLVDQLDLLDEIGVNLLKIDGFMQSSEYILRVSSIYLKAIEMYNNNISGYLKEKKNLHEEIASISKYPLDKGFFFKPTLYKVKK